jgi:hypothetical protein
VIEFAVTFALVCLATAFVCTALKEDEDHRLGLGSARLFAVMGGGIVGFGVVVQLLTLLAGN